jgi:hypothetical protein
MLRRIIWAGVCAVAVAATATAEPRDVTDPVAGYSMKIPDGWSDMANGQTMSADGAVQCTVTGQKVAQTAALSQDDVNTTMQGYTAEFWRQRFFAGGITGSIDNVGITKMEQYEAPWARGRVAYPTGQEVKFNALMIAGPGRLVSVTCLTSPGGYDKNFPSITIVLNWLRPL